VASAAAIVAASSALVMLSAPPSAFATECGATSGTVPGTPAQVVTVDASPAAVFYIDDRDYLDLDGDGVGGGLWIYMESNGQPGLQEGGEEFALASVPVGVPHIDPISVDGPDPVNHVVTLFPNGFGGGGNLAEAAGDVETCYDPSGAYDTIIF
jgi:hypothetical protein